jgi:hypothetical protein
LLEFRGRHREVMRPGLYTELFFLDEATALAAGHRPCAECRRQDYGAFRRCWATVHGEPGGKLPSADAMDVVLQQDRLVPPAGKKTYGEDIAALPDGVFLLEDGEAWLLWKAALLRWTPGGYDLRRARPTEVEVTVLTPRAMVRTIAAGYVSGVHESAGSVGPMGNRAREVRRIRG